MADVTLHQISCAQIIVVLTSAVELGQTTRLGETAAVNVSQGCPGIMNSCLYWQYLMERLYGQPYGVLLRVTIRSLSVCQHSHV